MDDDGGDIDEDDHDEGGSLGGVGLGFHDGDDVLGDNDVLIATAKASCSTVDDDDDEYDDDDDYDSDGLGSTVVHNDCPSPPPNATVDEINRLYWEWC